MIEFSTTELVLAVILVLGTIAYFVIRSILDASSRKKQEQVRTFFVPTAQSKKSATDTSLAGRPKMLILYGSQTGTAEEFSRRIGAVAKNYKFNPVVKDMEDIDETSEFEDVKVLVLVAATYGEGEPTDNAQRFYEWLKNTSHADDLFAHLKFTVFGLGNKTYKHFNAIGRFFNTRLAELGAQPVHQYGEGDDDGSMEDDFRAWDKGLWPALVKEFAIDTSDIKSIDDQDIEYFYKLTLHDHGSPAWRVGSIPPEQKGIDAKQIVHIGKVRKNVEMHNKQLSDRSCIHVEIDITNCPVSYEAGDHMAIYPRNDPDVVSQICNRLGYSREQIFQLSTDRKDAPKRRYPVYCSVDSALSFYCDLTGAATVRFLKGCSELASDPQETEHLKRLCGSSDKAREEYVKFVVEPYRSVVDVLDFFKSVHIPLEKFLELVAPLHPRYYSIASSSKVAPKTISLCVAVTSYTTPGGRFSHGVATRHLNSLKADDSPVLFSIRRSTFKLPAKSSVPLILIGPGTGYAPFRGFLQEKALQKANGDKVGRVLVFFGCRRADEDYIYRDELEQLAASGVIELHVAFSRDPANAGKKVYVQHKLLENASTVYDLLCEGGHVYVCGDASNMAKDVDNALKECIKTAGKKSENDAQNYVKMLLDKGRYAQDVW